MPWAGGNYTKGNSATGGWTGDQSLGIGIEAGRHDTQDNDFATGINQCLNKDGSNSATGNLNIGGFKLTNVATGVASTDAITLGQAQAGINTSGTALGITNTRFSADTAGPVFTLAKSRGASVGTNTIVQSGDQIGVIAFNGANGTSYNNAAAIIASVDGTPGPTNDMPGALRFYTTPDGSGSLTERMIIKATGRVGIGTTSPGNYFVTVNSESNAIATGYFQSNVSGDVATHGLIVTKYDNNTTTSQRLVGFFCNQGVSGQGQINANGASQAAFGSFSDARLKENITDLPSQLSNIMALRPVEFDYKDGSGHQIGFIAQEVENVYPDLIGDDGNGYLTLTGLGKNEARMIKAFQEFAELTQGTIAALEARIAALEEA